MVGLEDLLTYFVGIRPYKLPRTGGRRPEHESQLLAWCRDEVRFQIYQCATVRRITGGEPRLKEPKAGFFTLARAQRPAGPRYRTSVGDS